MTLTTAPIISRADPTPPLLYPPANTDRPPKGSAQRTAIITLTAALIFQPMLHPSGPGNSSPIDIFTIAAIVTGAIWLTGTHRRLRAPYCIPVALILCAGAASGLAGPLPSVALTTLIVDLLLFVWCLTVVNVLEPPRAMRTAMAAWSWAGIGWAAVVVISWIGHITFIEGLVPAEGNRVLFTFGDPNYAATYWDATIFVVYAARTPASRPMRIAGYVLLACALGLTESNGGVLALGGGILFLLLVRSYRRRGWVGVAATVMGAGICAGGFFTALPLNQIRAWALASGQPILVNSIGRSAQSSQERRQLISESLQLYENGNGLVGYGPASTKPLLTTLRYPYANEAHDDILAALVERGPLGVLGIFLLFSSAGARASPVISRPVSARYAAAIPRPAGIAASLLSLSINSFYEEVLHFRFLWALFAIIAVLGKDARR